MFLYLHKIVNKIISWLMFITPTSLYIYIYIISYIEYSKCLLFIFNIYWMFLSYVYNILSVWECKKKVLEGAKTIVSEVSFINFFKKDMFSNNPLSVVVVFVDVMVNFSYFHLLLQNHWANFDQTYAKYPWIKRI